MSWSANLFGHVDSKEEEAAVIEKLSAVCKEIKAGGASGGFQHHGTVNLLSDDPTGGNKE